MIIKAPINGEIKEVYWIPLTPKDKTIWRETPVDAAKAALLITKQGKQK